MTETEESGIPGIIEIPNPDPRWAEPICCGDVLKATKSIFRSWTRRFFILTRNGRIWSFKPRRTRLEPEREWREGIPIQGLRFWLDENLAISIAKSASDSSRLLRFRVEDESECSKWCRLLRLAGAIRIARSLDSETPKKEEEEEEEGEWTACFPSIARLDVDEWSVEEVRAWLEFEGYGKLQDAVSVTGSTLVRLRESDLQGRGLGLRDRKKLARSISLLRTSRKFDFRNFLVQEKLSLAASWETTSSFVKARSTKTVGKSLSDARALLESFLHSSAPPIEEGVPRSLPRVEGENLFLEEESEFTVKYVLYQPRSLRKKLYRSAAKLPCSVGRSLPRKLDFVYPALLVGPFWLHWDEDNGGVCIPRNIQSKYDLIDSGVNESCCVPDMVPSAHALRQIARVVADWNCRKTYIDDESRRIRLHARSFRDQPENRANAQEFVDAVLRSLNVEIRTSDSDQSSSLKTFVGQLRRDGLAEMTLQPSEEFRQKFSPTSEAEIHFNTHQELDEFARMCIEKDDLSFREMKSEFALLERFDKVFSVLRLRKLGFEKYAPSDCPFQRLDSV